MCTYESMCVCVCVHVCACVCLLHEHIHYLLVQVAFISTELASISFPMTCKFFVAMVTVLIWVGEAYEHVHFMVVLMCSDVILQA